MLELLLNFFRFLVCFVVLGHHYLKQAWFSYQSLRLFSVLRTYVTVTLVVGPVQDTCVGEVTSHSKENRRWLLLEFASLRHYTDQKIVIFIIILTDHDNKCRQPAYNENSLFVT